MAGSIKERIRKTLKNSNNVTYRISEVKSKNSNMTRKIFIETMQKLKEIEERSDFMVDELGIDITAFEDKFLSIIENLLKLSFNDIQLTYINLYLYELLPNEDEYDGVISIEKNKKTEKYPFKTPEDVWDLIQKFK